MKSLLLLSLAGLCAIERVGAQLPDTSASTHDFAAIDRYAERMLRDTRVPAAAIAIVRGDRIVHMRGFGRDSRGRPVTGQTSFVLGSMSKSLTALAVMQLVEKNRIGLDFPVQRYLPAFRLALADSGASVTVRQLLLHTSGIPHGAARGGAGGRSLSDRVASLRDVTPRDTSGTVHAYASPNYLVLGAIVEKVSGEPFATYVEREIFEPLAMRNSFTDRTRALGHRFAGGNVYAFGFPVPSSVPEEQDRLPTAGLMSSAEDLSHFLAMQLRQGRFAGNQLLGAESVRTMHTGGAPSDGFSYAFGWRDGSIAGTRAVHHGGIVADFRGKMVMLPDSGWGVVVLTNASSAMPWPLASTSHQLADDIAANLVGRPLPTRTSRHQLFFAVASIAMLILVALQLRALRRAWQGARLDPRAVVRSRDGWRANAIDVGFVAFFALLPKLVGLTWTDLLHGAPDVAWWLIMLAALGTATVGVRAMRGSALRRSSVV